MLGSNFCPWNTHLKLSPPPGLGNIVTKATVYHQASKELLAFIPAPVKKQYTCSIKRRKGSWFELLVTAKVWPTHCSQLREFWSLHGQGHVGKLALNPPLRHSVTLSQALVNNQPGHYSTEARKEDVEFQGHFPQLRAGRDSQNRPSCGLGGRLPGPSCDGAASPRHVEVCPESKVK